MILLFYQLDEQTDVWNEEYYARYCCKGGCTQSNWELDLRNAGYFIDVDRKVN